MADPQTTIAQKSASTGTTTLSFPSNITSAAYYTRITFYKYSRQRPNSNAERKVTATIILPIPEGFGDQQVPNWGQNELYQYGGAADTMADWYDTYRRGESVFEQVKNTISSGMNASTSNLRNAGVLAMSLTTQSQRDGAVQTIIGQSLGAVVNPHLSLSFGGMALRQHQLQFKMAPRNENESTSLGNIISKIRTESLPSFNEAVSRYALDYPSVCEVEFYGIDSNYKTKILRSAVTGFTTSLGPSGLAFYPKGVPVEVEMVLSLQETEIVTREDYKNTKGQQK
jgi:hypothetical protein